jgi:hypothetical protein
MILVIGGPGTRHAPRLIPNRGRGGRGTVVGIGLLAVPMMGSHGL